MTDESGLFSSPITLIDFLYRIPPARLAVSILRFWTMMVNGF